MWNALQAGAYTGSPLETVKLLVDEMGEDALKMQDGDGKTLLHLAVIGRNQGMPVTMELIEYLVTGFPEATKIVDKDGNVPLDTNAFLDLILYLQSRCEERVRKRRRLE
jgi:ankyrin repeat protein